MKRKKCTFCKSWERFYDLTCCSNCGKKTCIKCHVTHTFIGNIILTLCRDCPDKAEVWDRIHNKKYFKSGEKRCDFCNLRYFDNSGHHTSFNNYRDCVTCLRNVCKRCWFKCSSCCHIQCSECIFCIDDAVSKFGGKCKICIAIK